MRAEALSSCSSQESIEEEEEEKKVIVQAAEKNTLILSPPRAEDKKPEDYIEALSSDPKVRDAYTKEFSEILGILATQDIHHFSEEQCKRYFDKFRKTSTHKRTIVFGLDGTLVRTAFDKAKGSALDINIQLRPKLDTMLQTLSKHYELIVFSTSQPSYTKAVVDAIQANGTYFSHVLSNKHTIDKYLIKDMKILMNGRNLKDLLIVDNRIKSFMTTLANGVFVPVFDGSEDDNYLEYLQQYLLDFAGDDDVRDKLSDDFDI